LTNQFLLDTHILIWWLESKDRLSQAQQEAIRNASPDSPLLLSDISLWEIAVLYELGRIRLALPLREWLERATAPPLVQRCGISPAIAAELASLPATLHRDPADRIIISTARVFGATLLTSDSRIISSGIVPTLS
jgi:PIN domain nuclease of toxin-antitoxin system